MGFYVGKEYHIVRADEMDLFSLMIGNVLFIFQGLYTIKHIKAKVKQNFSKIADEALNEKFEILNLPTLQDIEKLRLDFNNKESVFNYYIHTTENYNLYKKDKIYNTLDRLYADLEQNNHKYFQRQLIKDFFTDLKINIQHYLRIEFYKECLENPENLILTIDDKVIDQTLQDLIDNDVIYTKLIKGLKDIEFLDNEGQIIMDRERVPTDIAILFIKLLEVKFSNLRNFINPELKQIMQNTFGISPKVKYFNTLRNLQLSHNIDSAKKRNNNEKFYDKLKFIDAIDN